jgi:hypothetical protein
VAARGGTLESGSHRLRSQTLGKLLTHLFVVSTQASETSYRTEAFLVESDLSRHLTRIELWPVNTG